MFAISLPEGYYMRVPLGCHVRINMEVEGEDVFSLRIARVSKYIWS